MIKQLGKFIAQCLGTAVIVICLLSIAGIIGFGSGVPASTVAAFKLSSCPTGWKIMDGTAATPDMRGRYIVGLPSGGTLSSTVGTALTAEENRAVGQHLHSIDPPSTSASITDPGHNHAPRINAGGASPSRVNTTADWNDAYGSDTSTNTTGITASVDIAAFNSANSGSVAGTNAPYGEFIMCLKD